MILIAIIDFLGYAAAKLIKAAETQAIEVIPETKLISSIRHTNLLKVR